MRNLFLKRQLGLIILFTSFHAAAQGQVMKEMFFPVSYVSATTIYISAGRDDSLAIGDTLTILRNKATICKVVAVAVSRHSTATQIVSGKAEVMVGDTATIIKIIGIAQILNADTLSVSTKPNRRVLSPQENSGKKTSVPEENVVSGRVALQYSGVSAEDSRLNLSQPSTLIRLEVDKLFGTALRFSTYGRTYYDLSSNYNRYGDDSRLKIRMYEFTLSDEQPGGVFGYSAGRIASRFVGGLGTFDGGQLYYRMGDVTSGILYGAKVADRTMSIDGDDRREALFVNYHNGPDFLHQYDGTIAFARELFEGRLDREFIYIQNIATLGTEVNLYQSSELETQDVNNGVRSSSLKLSNTFVSLNYYPVEWFSTNVGYDASKTVYLFETMKTTPDTLIDRSYLQGYRLSATFRLPSSISISGNATYRTRKEDPRDARTLGGTFRYSSIAGSEINAGLRYMNIRGVYNDGNNITLDIDRTFFYSLSVSLRYDYYTYTLLTASQTYTTHTATANINYRVSREVYSALNFDRVWDSTVNSYRVYIEAGIRF